MEYACSVVQAVAHQTAAVRRPFDVSTLSSTIISGLDEVYAFLKTGAIKQKGLNVVVYDSNAHITEIGVEVSGPFASTGPVTCSATPAGSAATTAHFGPYSNLPAAHKALRQWCAQNNKPLTGTSWEVYGHWNDDIAKVQTDVFYLLR